MGPAGSLSGTAGFGRLSTDLGNGQVAPDVAAYRRASGHIHRPPISTRSSGAPVEQHSPLQSVLLHVLPGCLTGAAYFALIPLLHGWGYPAMMAYVCAAAFVLIPMELGFLLRQGQRIHGYLTVRGVVSLGGTTPFWQSVIWGGVLIAVLALIFVPLKPVDRYLQHSLFAWVPVFESGLEGGGSAFALTVTYVLAAIVVAVIAPIVEELYFRGYLLPRMEYAGKWSALVHGLLFGLYHVWTPWMFVTRMIGTLPLVIAARRRNLNLAIFAHVFVNLLDPIAAFIYILAMIQRG